MKVYVDFEDLDKENLSDNALIRISKKGVSGEISEHIQLQSLANHDMQVRKQVCDEIREIADLDDWEEINGYTLEKILDQIEKGGQE